ncbi:GNAT family N-acetyltransferase [Massilia sp. CCM 8695]|uniref:GNAT family N-acetyltransferase n=1 Tax=Massilia frigida TaxID=2609281 RepID=A0ABX0N826_9BURK|nr:GNAT family N-acetyltransferase [Massilia frigida]NHZ78203.1 GNAT family N-acetyltransferase [Massilia frigida]
MHIQTLHTERLVLLPPSAACEEMYESFYTDADASGPYGGPLTSAAAWSRLAADLGAWHVQGFGVWAIARRDAGELLGVCGFWQGKGWPRELTWWLLPQARSAGIAQEASRAVIAHAHQVFQWPSLETYMNDDNHAARALVRRLGAVVTGRRSFPDGGERDVFRFPRSQPASEI